MEKRIGKNMLLSAVFLLLAMCPAQAVFAAQAGVLNMTRLLFVDNVIGLGQYTPKQGERFAIGDLCTIYIETTGFTLRPTKPDSEDEFDLDLAVDVVIMAAQGRITTASAKDFITHSTTVFSKLSATFLFFSFIFEEGWDPGNYLIEITLRDNLSGQSVTREIAYRLEEPTEADRARQSSQ